MIRYLAPTNWSHQSRNRRPKPARGIEPRDEGTSLCPCPPSWAPRADDGHRTRDIHFGRVTLCQLSYIRIRPGLFCPTEPLGFRTGRLAVHLTPMDAVQASQPVLTPEESASQVRADWWSVAVLRPRTQYPAPPAGTYADLLHPHFSLRTPPGARTPHPLIKSQVLWPDELEAHIHLPATDLTPLRASGARAVFLAEVGTRAGRMAASGIPSQSGAFGEHARLAGRSSAPVGAPDAETARSPTP